MERIDLFGLFRGVYDAKSGERILQCAGNNVNFFKQKGNLAGRVVEHVLLLFLRYRVDNANFVHNYLHFAFIQWCGRVLVKARFSDYLAPVNNGARF
jgi:hypothetical protein